MRFVVFVKATALSEAGVLPTAERFAAMDVFNEELAGAGVLLAAEGLQASSKGARLHFSGGKADSITDGPFTETKELIAGFWIVQGKSKAEVVERFSRAPMDDGNEIEIRQVFEPEDFADIMPPGAADADASIQETV